ncbi:class F sortase [Nocardioides sp. SYSU D00038]|uniref:class F sortase n=1 Tax=Nocardioides sp. SYSU D00038 TaxID=2812554 RepID=UPI001967310E|nr:class F sortase [Nocardioides sp. SYSU D00038]
MTDPAVGPDDDRVDDVPPELTPGFDLLDRLAGKFSTVTTVVTAVVLLAVVGLLGWSVLGPDDDDDEPAAASAGARYETLKPAEPLRLIARSVKIAAPIVPIQVSPDAVLDPPRDPKQVGWWDASAEPGALTGQTVITGHTVHTGGGAMDRVDRLEPGQFVDVQTQRGTMRYEVTKVSVLSKDEVAEKAVSLFGQETGDGRLVLVSCDDWNGRFYESNVIVFGKPLGKPVKTPKPQDTTRASAG